MEKADIYKNKKTGIKYKILYYGYNTTNNKEESPDSPCIIYCRQDESPPQLVFSKDEPQFKCEFEKI